MACRLYPEGNAVQKTLTSQSHMAPTHLEKLILELLSMQRSVFVGVLWTASLGPSTVLAISGFLTLGELGGLGRHL
uniref:Uncharacterized protein n=1 Tax=Solanum lycopersicum TaxID=4081 RepID=A0A3Q7FXQ2_SOLLC